MSYLDYRPEQLQKIDALKIKDGVSTICKIASLFNLGVDCFPFPSSIFFICGINRLNNDELTVMKELITENIKDK